MMKKNSTNKMEDREKQRGLEASNRNIPGAFIYLCD